MKTAIIRLLPLTFIIIIALSGCAAKAFRDGKQALHEEDYDQAVAEFQQAAEKRPENHEYRMYLQRAKVQTALFHLGKGRQLRSAGDFEGALNEFQLSLILDPSLETAAQETLATQKAQQSLEKFRKAELSVKNGELDSARQLVVEILREDPRDHKAKSLLKEIDQRLSLSGHRLERLFKNNNPVDLEFKKTDIRESFEILSQLSGTNFIVDDSVSKDMVDLDLKNATLLQGLELLLNIYKLQAKPLNDKTVLIFSNSSEKNKQYDDYKIKTYYLSHVDAKQVVNLLRTMLKIKNIFVHEERNALVFRERPEVIQLAEQIIAAADRADSEVLFELELIEVNHSDDWKFGPSLNPNSVSFGLAKGGNVVASGLSSGDATTNLVESFSGLESVYTLPTAVFDLQKTLVDSEILSTPKIRVKNREKAKVHVGTREPVITVTTTGETSTDNIQYVDVGVKLDIEPHIQLDNTVVTKLSLEVSSVTEKTTTANGSLALSISTTNAQTSLTLKDSERTVIGGLIRDDDTKTRKTIPILGDLPLIGRLFTNHNKDTKKREILLSITPHILRNVDLPDAELTDIWSGSEDELKTEANFASFMTPADSLLETASPVSATAENPPAVPGITVPAPLDPSALSYDTEAEQQLIEEEKVDEPQLPILPATDETSLLLTAPQSVIAGQTFEVVIGLTGAADLHGTSMNLTSGGGRLSIMEITEGGFLGTKDRDSHFSVRQNPEGRGYAIDYDLPEGHAGVSGDGKLARVVCKATSSGQVLLGVEDVKLQDSKGSFVPLPSRKILLSVK